MCEWTLTLRDVGEGEIEAEVKGDGMPEEGSLAAARMKGIIAWLEGESLPDEYTVH